MLTTNCPVGRIRPAAQEAARAEREISPKARPQSEADEIKVVRRR
jgi:hypothetical protein